MSEQIKQWHERTNDLSDQGCIAALKKEVVELRAALASKAPSAPQDEPGDSWITAKVARHLDIQFRNGVTAGWNAGLTEDTEALDKLKGRVGTRAEYAALFPAPSAPVAREACTWTPTADHLETCAWDSACGETWLFIEGGTPAEHRVKFCHGCGKPVVAPTPPPSTLAQQVASAQAEVAKWPKGKLARVKLAGGDQP